MQVRTPRDVGLVIREQRKRLGIGQAALAQKVGVSRQWIVAVEKGKPGAALGLVLRTLIALDVTIDAALLAHPAPPAASSRTPDDEPIDLLAIDDVLRRSGSDR